jgi:Ca2+-binding RTX toxin-like protein
LPQSLRLIGDCRALPRQLTISQPPTTASSDRRGHVQTQLPRRSNMGRIFAFIYGLAAYIFMFNTALGVGNVDTITDYNVAEDIIRLENAIFSRRSAA